MFPLATISHALGASLVLVGLFYIAIPVLVLSLIAFIAMQTFGEHRRRGQRA